MGCSAPPKQPLTSAEMPCGGWTPSKHGLQPQKKSLCCNLSQQRLFCPCSWPNTPNPSVALLLLSPCFPRASDSSCTGLNHSNLVCSIFQLLSQPSDSHPPSHAQVFPTRLAPALISFWEYTLLLSPQSPWAIQGRLLLLLFWVCKRSLTMQKLVLPF